MAEDPDLRNVTDNSIGVASERIRAGETDAAVAIVRQLMRLLREHKGMPLQEQCLGESLETLGDAFEAAKEHEQAISAYEEALSLRSKTAGETAPESMAVLFKLEKTLCVIALEAMHNVSAKATGTRWRSRLVASAEDDGSAALAAAERGKSLPTEELNMLWEKTLKKNQEARQAAETKRAAREFELVNGTGSNEILDRLVSMGGQIFLQFLPVIMLCLLVGVGFRFMPQISKAMGGMGKFNYVDKAQDLKFISMQSVPANTADTLHGIVDGTNRTYVSGDESQKLRFDNSEGEFTQEGRSYNMPYVVDDGSPMNRAALCLYTLGHKKTLWLVPDLYGLEDQFGNVYFADGSSERRLASQVREMALHLQTLKPDEVKSRLNDQQYDDPWTGGKANVAILQAKADSLESALQQLKPQISKHDPFSVFCLMVDTGKQTQIGLFGLGRDHELIPFGNRARTFLGLNGAPEPKVPTLDPDQINGIVVLPVPSLVARYAGQFACFGLAALCFFGVVFARTNGARLVFFLISAGLAVCGAVGMVNAG
jgi:tetratricopeptide (TPR) repeat protein